MSCVDYTYPFMCFKELKMVILAFVESMAQQMGSVTSIRCWNTICKSFEKSCWKQVTLEASGAFVKPQNSIHEVVLSKQEKSREAGLQELRKSVEGSKSTRKLAKGIYKFCPLMHINDFYKIIDNSMKIINIANNRYAELLEYQKHLVYAKAIEIRESLLANQ